jgi:hypothetical protein
VRNAKVVSLADARGFRGIWGDHWEQCVRDLESKRRSLGLVAAVAVDLYPLPITFLKLCMEDMQGLEAFPNWQWLLKVHLNTLKPGSSEGTYRLFFDHPLFSLNGLLSRG